MRLGQCFGRQMLLPTPVQITSLCLPQRGFNHRAMGYVSALTRSAPALRLSLSLNKKCCVMAGWQRSVRAHHEAGHAVIARKLGIKIDYADVVRGLVPSESASERAKNLGVPEQAQDYEKDANVTLAGFAAQRRSHPDTDLHFDSDVIVIEEEDDDMRNTRNAIYGAACLRAGTTAPRGNGEVKVDEAMQKEMRAVFARVKQETAALVAEHWPAIKRVAKALERHDCIDQAEVDRLIAVAER
jgi:hypothetical protein